MFDIIRSASPDKYHSSFSRRRIQGSIQGYRVPSKDTGHHLRIYITIQGYGAPSKHTGYYPWIRGTIQAYRVPSKDTGHRPRIQGTIQGYRAPSKDTEHHPRIQGTIQACRRLPSMRGGGMQACSDNTNNTTELSQLNINY